MKPAGARPTPSVAPTLTGIPKLTEAFTLLPCPAHPKTTVEVEGCAEHQIVRLDRRIDAEAQALYDLKTDPMAKADFAKAQQAWVDYRRAECHSESDAYSGGSLEPVAFANCEVRINQERVRDLRELQGELNP